MTQNISFIVAQISAYVCKICIDRLSIIEQIHGINHLTSISFTGSPITDARNCLGLASLNLASCLLCVSEIMRLILSANTLASSIQPIFLTSAFTKKSFHQWGDKWTISRSNSDIFNRNQHMNSLQKDIIDILYIYSYY